MTKRISKFGVIAILAIFSVSGQVIAQNKVLTISKEEKKQVVDSVAKFMTDYYVFPDIGKQIADVLIKKHKKGVYKPAKTYFEFSELLNKDLLSINNDRHIGMGYDPQEIKMRKESKKTKTIILRNMYCRGIRTGILDLKKLKYWPVILDTLN